MSIFIKGKESFIIDRTLMNLTERSLKEIELYKFTINLKRIGVDFFEVDERTYNLVKPLIVSEAFIFRIDTINQLEICKNNNIDYIILSEEDLDNFKNSVFENNYNFKIILEINANVYRSDLINKISENIDINKLFALRFKGVCSWDFDDFSLGGFNVKKNIYASNELFMATAVGVQSILKGFNYITTAFCGKDGVNDTTALEEILLSTKIILEGEINGEISLLSEMREQYEKITYTKIANNKAVIGKDIFKYESGVHVAGIEKNPDTYEPYSPELVGLKRKLALGKHSGKNSINSKLKEMGIENNFSVGEIISILNEVKNKSILNKMEVTDKEFMDICKRIEG